MNLVITFLAENIAYIAAGAFVFVLVMSRFRRLADPVFAGVAIALLVGFLGYLIFEIPQLNLVIVVVSVLAMALYDFWSSNRRNGDNGER